MSQPRLELWIAWTSWILINFHAAGFICQPQRKTCASRSTWLICKGRPYRLFRSTSFQKFDRPYTYSQLVMSSFILRMLLFFRWRQLPVWFFGMGAQWIFSIIQNAYGKKLRPALTLKRALSSPLRWIRGLASLSELPGFQSPISV